MEIVTTISRQWRNRMLLQTVFFIGFALWFFYDGTFTYPKHNERVAEFRAAKARGEASDWPEFAGKHGWPGQDHPAPYSRGEITTQFVLGAISAEVGLMVFVWFLITRKLKMTSDGQTVCGVRGQQVPLEAFVGVDRRKWDRKGIAYAFYEENGQRRRREGRGVRVPRRCGHQQHTSNITPVIGGNIIGGSHPFPSKHVHDDLHARCLVLDNGQTHLAFAVCDFIGLSRYLCDEARRLVHEETGVPAANLLMSGTRKKNCLPLPTVLLRCAP